MHFESSAPEFLERCREFLLEHEIELNGLTLRARALAARPDEGATFFVELDETAIVRGVALHPGEGQTLQISDLTDAAIEALVERFSRTRAGVPEVYGPRGAVQRFAERWSERRGDCGTLVMEYGLFSTQRITRPPCGGGGLVVAGTADRPRVSAWLEAFQREALPMDVIDRERIERMVEFRVERGDVGLWRDRDGEVRSMAARNRETERGACISWVYTPPGSRGRGFGGLVTAHWCEKLLAEGAHYICLYTDLANPTSNRLYPRLGFRKLGEDARIRFAERPGASACFEEDLPEE